MPAPAAGTKLGPYEILSPIGAGGMGEVYRGRDTRLGREVAIKVLPSSLSADPDRLRRFEQEARSAGILNHPNITAVYDIGTDPADGSPYVVQELLEGDTLRSVLAGGRLSPRKAIDYALQIAHGLSAAHEKGIAHRDLKPENLFVTRDGRLKILDFGLAKLISPRLGKGEKTDAPTVPVQTESGMVLGTVGYMSPEQVRGQPADHRTDIFSFGSILYEMLTGRRAFHGDSAADTMSAILKEDPPELSLTNQNISPGLERIVRHCLEKNPEQRFQSTRDLAFDLEALSGLSGVGAAYEAVTALGRADAMGLVPEGQRIETLDLPALRKVVRQIQRAGIGKRINLVLADDLMDQTSTLERLLEQLNIALEESPAPEYEWVRLVTVLGIDQLARLLGISESSVRRYKATARTTPDDVAARLHFLALIVGDLSGAYNDIGIRQWFDRKRAQLGGRAPAELLAGQKDPTAPGPARVRELARSLAASPAT